MNRIIGIVLFLPFWVETLWAVPLLQNLDYSDSLDSLANPECGFYDAKVLPLTPDGKIPYSDGRWSTWGKLFQMRVDISLFSDNGCFPIDSYCENTRPLTDSCKVVVNESACKSQPLTNSALNLLKEYFEEARQEDRSLIVRFAYDSWYDGHSNGEPDQETILGHIRQVGPIYSEYSDVIVFVELGLYGRWGEMNGSTIGTNETIAEAMQTLLENTSNEIKVGPRRPDIVAAWMGLQTRNDKGWSSFTDFYPDSEKFKQMKKAKGDSLYRVSMYNDGYLGNDSDMGTIGYGDPGRMTREMLNEWLEDYGSYHSPYGGELVYNSNNAGTPAINTPRFLSYEGFRTHTSYLNRFHHKLTIDSWNDSVFTARDSVDKEYNGKNGFVYVRNHLGYRYILRESVIEDSVAPGEDLNIKLKIQNAGFGNMTQFRNFALVVRREGDSAATVFAPSKSIDPRDILSRRMTKDTVTTFDGINRIEFSLPGDVTEKLGEGKYKIYVKIFKDISDKLTSKMTGEQGASAIRQNYQCVRFGNVVSQYDSATCGNDIGGFVISREATTSVDHFVNSKNGATFSQHDRQLLVRGASRIEIFDLLGHKIYYKYLSCTTEQTISLRSFATGNYLIRLWNGSRTQMSRILVP